MVLECQARILTLRGPDERQQGNMNLSLQDLGNAWEFCAQARAF